jgi:acyl phosphate:glycerol-3-phosphate acyltransferase
MLLGISLLVLASYLLGSIPTGYLLVRLFRDQDIRSVGSGNIGATNVLRSGGKGLGAATFLLDVLKGAVAVLFAALIAPQFSSVLHPREVEAIAAVVAVLGHMFPIWLSFRGGKGVATGFGVFLVAAPWAALASITLFFLVLMLSRYVSLASILGAGSFPVFAWFFVHGEKPALFIAAQIIVSMLIILKHHANIRRLLTGTENRFGSHTQERKPA